MTSFGKFEFYVCTHKTESQRPFGRGGFRVGEIGIFQKKDNDGDLYLVKLGNVCADLSCAPAVMIPKDKLQERFKKMTRFADADGFLKAMEAVLNALEVERKRVEVALFGARLEYALANHYAEYGDMHQHSVALAQLVSDASGRTAEIMGKLGVDVSDISFFTSGIDDETP